MSKLSKLTDIELEQKLKATKAIRLTVGGIFGIIVSGWIVMGYWHSNIPVFISTIVMGVTTLLVTSIAPQQIAT
ncbi:MAG: hypothetical protein Q8M16_06495, partial [Pirellulaceae bacterium]|nr:hypothetical protein [Pirellulaceae bacterium]